MMLQIQNQMLNDQTITLWRGFGQYLKQVRERLNYSQEGIAQKVGLTRQQWNRLENGLSGTKRETVIKIAERLNLNEVELLNKAGFDAPKNQVAVVPKPILEALAREGELRPDDELLIADFIKRLKQSE